MDNQFSNLSGMHPITFGFLIDVNTKFASLSFLSEAPNKIFSLLRLKAFETFTDEGRSNERHRRIALSALASALAQGVTITSSVIWVPLSIHYLGNERYGIWMTITSVIAMLQFADFGIGNSLINTVSKAKGQDNHAQAKKYISTSLLILFGIGISLILIFTTIYPFISWSKIFNTQSVLAQTEAGPSMAVFMVCFSLGLPLLAVQKVQMGWQEGYLSSLWQAVGGILSLLGILLAIYLKLGLPWLILSIAGAPLLASIINNIIHFGFKRPELRPRFRFIDFTKIKRLLNTGLLFFSLSLGAAMGFQADNIVLAQMIGPEAVTKYSIVSKLYLVIPLLLGHIFTPLWPAYGEAMARKDITWVKRTLKKSLSLGLLVNLPFSILLFFFGTDIIKFWIGPQITISNWLLLGFSIWAILNSFTGPFAMFFNGANIIGFQVILALLMGVFNLLFSIFLVEKIDLSGAIFGTITAQILFTIIPSWVYLRSFFRKHSPQ